MKSPKVFVSVWLMLMGSCLLTAGCTPESPPLPPLVSSEERTAAVSAESSTDLSSESAESKIPSEPSKEEEVLPDITIWDDSKGELVEICYRFAGETADTDYYRTDDAVLLEKLTAALKGLKVQKETDERVTDDTVILLYTAKNSSGRLTFEHGGLIEKGKRYELEGYPALAKVLTEIADSYPAWKEKYDEWIHRMSAVQDPVKEMTTSDEYQAAALDQRRTMAMNLLKQLEEKELIKSGSIYDGGDAISFVYNCDESGVSGAVMLQDFDARFN